MSLRCLTGDPNQAGSPLQKKRAQLGISSPTPWEPKTHSLLVVRVRSPKRLSVRGVSALTVQAQRSMRRQFGYFTLVPGDVACPLRSKRSYGSAIMI